MRAAFAAHWREYLIEGALLGLFMVSAGGFATLLYAEGAPGVLLSPVARDLVMGAAMGLTAVALVYSPAGQRSGAHMNPAVTLSFLRLGKIERWDALFYLLAQSLGGLIGVIAVEIVAGRAFVAPPVRSVVTVPGRWGSGAAFLAELAMTFVLFEVILVVSNREGIRRWTGVVAGALIALFIAFEAPVSGMSLNPARSLASALPSGIWSGFWIYLLAPLAGMLLAAEVYVRARGAGAVLCAKLHHTDRHDCLFRCGFCRHPAAGSGIEAGTEGMRP